MPAAAEAPAKPSSRRNSRRDGSNEDSPPPTLGFLLVGLRRSFVTNDEEPIIGVSILSSLAANRRNRVCWHPIHASPLARRARRHHARKPLAHGRSMWT